MWLHLQKLLLFLGLLLVQLYLETVTRTQGSGAGAGVWHFFFSVSGWQLSSQTRPKALLRAFDSELVTSNRSFANSAQKPHNDSVHSPVMSRELAVSKEGGGRAVKQIRDPAEMLSGGRMSIAKESVRSNNNKPFTQCSLFTIIWCYQSRLELIAGQSCFISPWFFAEVCEYSRSVHERKQIYCPLTATGNESDSYGRLS